jgi:putative membrane protein
LNLLIRWAVTGLALFAADRLFEGIYVTGNEAWQVYALMAIVFGLVNLLVKPVMKLLTCPIQLLTLGLFSFVINAIALWLSSYLATTYLDIGFHVDGFVPAFLGALVISIVSTLLGGMLLENE